MRQLVSLAGAALLAFGMTSAALADPDGQGVHGNHAQLTCGVGFVCTIDLPARAMIAESPIMFGSCHGSSDKKTGCLWQLDWSNAAGGSSVYISPNYDGLKTNVVIPTSAGSFDVDLRADARATRAEVSFARASMSGGRSAAADRSGSETASPGPTIADVVRVANAAVPDIRWQDMDPNYCSSIEGHPDFKPLWVMNDGARTIMAMPYPMAFTPTVFENHEGQRIARDVAKMARIWIFDGTPQQFQLFVGDGKSADRVTVSRQVGCAR